jgi:hypothetical protein
LDEADIRLKFSCKCLPSANNHFYNIWDSGQFFSSLITSYGGLHGDCGLLRALSGKLLIKYITYMREEVFGSMVTAITELAGRYDRNKVHVVASLIPQTSHYFSAHVLPSYSRGKHGSSPSILYRGSSPNAT